MQDLISHTLGLYRVVERIGAGRMAGCNRVGYPSYGTNT